MRLLPLVLFAACVRCLPAQEPPKIAPPKFPLALRAPEKASWTVVAKPKDGAADAPANDDGSAPSFVETLTVTKTAPIYEEKATVRNGPGWEKWTILTGAQPYRLVRTAGSAGWQRLADTNLETGSRFESSDFADLEWLEESNYRGVEIVDDRPVHVFHLETTSPMTKEDAAEFDYGAAIAAASEGKSYGRTYVYRAWLDPNSLLPVMLDDGRRIRTFTFVSPPVARLTPPAGVVAELKKWLEEVKGRSR